MHKPARWAVSPALVDPRWRWFRDHCVLALPVFNGDAMSANGATIRGRSRYRQTPTVDNSSGDISIATTRLGRAFAFTGDSTNDRINFGSITSGNPLSLAGKSAFTIVVGLRYGGTPASSFPRIFDKSSSGGGNGGYVLYYDTSLGLEVHVNNQTRYRHTITLAAGDVLQVGFTCFALGTDGSFYIDGLPVATSIISSAASSVPTTTTNAAIGNWNHATNRMWDGNIDYVYILDAGAPARFFKEIHLDPFGPFRRDTAVHAIFSVPPITGAAFVQSIVMS